MIGSTMSLLPHFSFSLALLTLTSLLVSTDAGQPIKGPPVAEREQLTRVARLGSDIRLVCPLSSYPEALVMWTKSNEPIMPYTHTRLRLSRKSLRIRHLEKDDAGVYVCRGVNGFGSSHNVNIDLVVIDPADFPDLASDELPDVSPPSLTPSTLRAMEEWESVVPEGDSLRLLCEASGKPMPTIKWYKDNEPMPSMLDGWLSIAKTRIEDSGHYRCEASNVIGSVSGNVSLEVLVTSFETNLEQPRLPSGPINTTVTLGESAVLECLVQSASTPSIRWLKKVDKWVEDVDERDVIDVGDEKFVQIGKESVGQRNNDNEYVGNLLIEQADQGDQGMYYCFVTNPSGYRFKNAYLTVLPKKESRSRTSSTLSQRPLLAAGCALFFVLLSVLVLSVCFVRRTKKSLTNTSMETTLPEAQENLMRQQQQQQQGPNNNFYVPNVINNNTHMSNEPYESHMSTMPRGSHHHHHHRGHRGRVEKSLPMPPTTSVHNEWSNLFTEKTNNTNVYNPTCYPHPVAPVSYRYLHPSPVQNQYEVPHYNEESNSGNKYPYSMHGQQFGY